jgi:hypothetical protein
MTNIEILKKIEQEYKDEFNKDKAGFKWNAKKRYAWAQIVSNLDLVIKYIEEFDRLTK